MEWAMSLLLNHPEFLKKARDEIDKQVGHKRFLEESDLHNLPYLNNIINETLRLYPTGPVVIHQSAKDCTVGGFHVPSDTMLQMNLWAVHRDPNVWVDPTKFNPERFEGIESEKNGFKFIPFGSGRRRCPGEGLAMRLVGLTLGSLIQCFEWKRVGEEMVDMSEGTGLTLPRANPLVAMCKPNPAMKHMITQI
ncbi:Cytochrome p450 [Thalictrum thalictroides]|uniref:Cytochrome p450 n=1 Tax=Thalictrum thalictroides TaxID=46969 RepID=A0A7J6VIY2_THATH|nr:Cytochrome p450 [Thalictrum thalictroides]